VKEYSHSDKFWKNYIELRDMCVELGLYQKSQRRRSFVVSTFRINNLGVL